MNFNLTIPHMWRRTAVWLAAAIATLLTFDLLWCSITNFGAFRSWSLYINLVPAAMLLATPSILWRRMWPQATLMLMGNVVMIANLMYARTYSIAIPLDSYLLAGNLAGFTGSIIESTRIADLILPMITVTAIVAARHFGNTEESPGRKVWFGTLAGLLAICAINFARKGGMIATLEEMSTNVDQSANVVAVHTIPLQLIYDAITADAAPTEAERKAVGKFIADTPPKTKINVYPRRNTVLILCESLESWPIGLRINGFEVTPRLNAITASDSALYYPNVITQVGAGRSIDAQLMIFTGLLPPSRGVWATKYCNNTFPSLIKALKERDPSLRATAMTLDKPDTWNQAHVARQLGFDRLMPRSTWDMSAPSDININDNPLDQVLFGQGGAEAIRMLDNTSQADFIMMVTTTGHNPFAIGEAHHPESLHRAHLPKILNDYIAVTHYVDSCIGAFIDTLAASGHIDDTSIIITGDHEGLASHRRNLATKFNFIDTAQHTPLIIIGATGGKTGRYERQIGQVDIYTTLLDLLGGDDYHWRGTGVSTFASPTERPDQKKVSDAILRGNLLAK